MTELRPSDLVEPAPEIGRPHGCCSGNGFDGRRPALGGAIKPEPERSALCLTVSVLGSLRNRIVRFCGQIKNPSRVHVRVPSAFGDFRLGGSTQRQAGLTRWGGACRHLIGETRRRAVDAEKFEGALIKSARIAGRFRTGPAANAPAPSSKTASPNRPTRAWPTRQPGPRPRSPPLAFDTGRPAHPRRTHAAGMRRRGIGLVRGKSGCRGGGLAGKCGSDDSAALEEFARYFGKVALVRGVVAKFRGHARERGRGCQGTPVTRHRRTGKTGCAGRGHEKLQ